MKWRDAAPWVLLLGGAVALASASPQPKPPPARRPPPAPRPRRRGGMQVGINYPWFNYGWDFGKPPAGWGARAAWRSEIDEQLQSLASLGIFSVRWFILGDGTNYGTPPDAVRPLTPEFEEDFVFLLERMRAAGLLFLPSLIDFHWCFAGQSAPGGVVKGGRAAVINNPALRTAFLDTVLERVLQLSAPYQDVVYAWELINEPEWCTRVDALRRGDPAKLTVSLANMLAYLSEGAARINAAGFQSTVGFADPRTPGLWKPQGLTLPQVHYWAQPPVLLAPSRPAILGEIATALHRPWPELGADQSVYARLRLAERKGYASCFLWAARNPGEQPPAVDWSPRVQQMVRRFVYGERELVS